MSHEITKTDGLVLTKQKAWHSLGIVVESAPNAREALKLAGIDWTVSGLPMFAGNQRVLTHVQNVRSDNGAHLGTVGKDYSPVQNSQLAELADALSSTGEVKIESAGSFQGGRRVFFLIQSKSIDVTPNDPVHTYLMLANGHDGSLVMRADSTDVRVVCRNTFLMALGAGSANLAKFKHTGDTIAKMDRVKALLQIHGTARLDRETKYKAMEAKSMTVAEVQAFFTDVYARMYDPIPTAPTNKSEERKRAKAVDIIGEWTKLFDADRVRTKGAASAWAAFNAVTEWVDHARPVHADTDRDYARLFSVRNNEDKALTFDRALALV